MVDVYSEGEVEGEGDDGVATGEGVSQNVSSPLDVTMSDDIRADVNSISDTLTVAMGPW